MFSGSVVANLTQRHAFFCQTGQVRQSPQALRRSGSSGVLGSFGVSGDSGVLGFSGDSGVSGESGGGLAASGNSGGCGGSGLLQTERPAYDDAYWEIGTSDQTRLPATMSPARESRLPHCRKEQCGRQDQPDTRWMHFPMMPNAAGAPIGPWSHSGATRTKVR